MRTVIAATLAAALCLCGAGRSAPASGAASDAVSGASSAAAPEAASQDTAVSPTAASCGAEPPSLGVPADTGSAGGEGTQSSVLRPDQVISILDHTVLWYRTLGTQQQFADQPSDQLILFADRQIADQVVALGFQIARADAELYTSQVTEKAAADAASSPQTLAKMRDRLLEEATQLQAHIDAHNKAPPAPVTAKARKASAPPEPQGTDDESRLQMLKARANLLNTMLDFAAQSNTETRRAAMFKSQIDAIAATIPAANGASGPGASSAGAAASGGGAAPAGGAATSLSSTKDADRAASGRTGLWDLGAAVWRMHAKLATISRLRANTLQLSQIFCGFQRPSRDQLLRYTRESDALATTADKAGQAQDAELRGKFDSLAWFFNQTSAIFIPLANEDVLLHQYVGNLDSWTKDSEEQYKDAWAALGKRLAIVAGILVGIFVVGEIWRRAVISLAHERSRLYQLLLVRRIVLWVAVAIVIGLSVVTEISSFATFAGLLTAGTAVAMQSVLVSVVGYFFLIGKYGVKVGDRVQIGAVAGEVIDIGLVRMHLMEYSTTGPLGPTGRVVAFANLIVFQASGGLFKQLSGTNLSWHEMSVTLPDSKDYAELKEALLKAVGSAVDEYRHEFVAGEAPEPGIETGGTQPQIHMRLAAGHMDATIRYPVTSAHAAEIDERVSEAVLRVIGR